MRGLVAMALLALLVSCGGGGPTEVVLVVDTDLVIPDAIDRIEITLSGTSGTPTNLVADLADPGTPSLPLTITAFAAEGASPELAVTVVGRLAGDEVTRWEARTRFISGETRMLRAILAARCLTITCASGESCDETGCRDVVIEPDGLSEWPGTPPILEGPACVPSEEQCNLYDDDCDDMVDEGIDTSIDAANCGECGRACGGGETCGGGYCDTERAIALAAGGAHTCVVRQSGAVACWGWNLYGQLGDGSVIDRPAPRTVSGVSGATAIGAGMAHSCAVAGGDVYCWGANGRGELGDGSTISRPVAAALGLTGVAEVAVGVAHTCALTAAGDVSCWGANSRGEVGDLMTEDALVPHMVIVGTPVVSVAAGHHHTCAAFETGGVSCWGANGSGQLGSGMIGMGVNMPTSVPGILTATDVTVGRRHSCARLMDDTVACWGANERGQLGTMGPMTSLMPVMVQMLTDAGAIFSGAAGSHICATTSFGASCWGANATGQVGSGDTGNVFEATPMLEVLETPAAIGAGGWGAAGVGHTCILEASGRVRCIGDGGLGQLGDGYFDVSADVLIEADLRL